MSVESNCSFALVLFDYPLTLVDKTPANLPTNENYSKALNPIVTCSHEFSRA